MRAALDANVLIYAEGLNGLDRQLRAQEVVLGLSAESAVVSVIVLTEIFSVLSRRGGRTREQARMAVGKWQRMFSAVPLTVSAIGAALDLAVEHQLQIWDAAILASAAEADCLLLLSEDLQHGFCWGGVTVVNPFARPQHPLLTALFGPA